MLPYLTALFVLFLTVKRHWRPVYKFFEEKVHPGDSVGGFSDLEMTWLLYCAGAATAYQAWLMDRTDRPISKIIHVRVSHIHVYAGCGDWRSSASFFIGDISLAHSEVFLHGIKRSRTSLTGSNLTA